MKIRFTPDLQRVVAAIILYYDSNVIHFLTNLIIHGFTVLTNVFTHKKIKNI